jgi:UDP-glucose 4-epimerase
MTTTLVTGGNGFIGRYVVDALLLRGREVIVLDRHQHHNLGAFDSLLTDINESVMLGDIRDTTAVTEAMSHCDSWMHLGGVLGTQETIANPLPAAETNVLGGLNMLQAAAQYKLPGVNIAVGNWWENNTYSISKHTVERFCSMYRQYRGLPVSVVRALNAYGPRQSIAAPYGPSKVRKIMPAFVMRALHGDPIEIYGSGQQIMDMIYVADAAEILVRALEYTERNGGYDGVFEAGTGRETTVNQIASAVIHSVGGGRIEYLPMRPGETPGAKVIGDPSTLYPLSWTSGNFTPLENGVDRTVEYYRDKLKGQLK